MTKLILLAVFAGLSCTLLFAQTQFSELTNPLEDVRTAVWNPQVGQGSEYDVTNNGTKTHVTLMILGTENVNGQTGYWLEAGMNEPRMGQVYTQMLMSLVSGQLHKTKWVLQLANKPPMQMPEGRMPTKRRGAPAKTDSDYRTRGERVGVETITVPAGTFQCEHWRAKDGSGDAWLSTSVVPYSVVKGVDKEGGTMILTKTITNAKSRITGKPVPFDPTLLLAAGNDR